jgi:hypothetical protein
VTSDAKSNREGYLAMVEFLRAYAERAQAGSLATLLADVEIAGDGEPFDPAMWSDWLAALEVVREATSTTQD